MSQRVEIAGPGFVNFHLAGHVAARRPARPSSLPATGLRPFRPPARARRSMSSSSAPTPPAPCTPATPVAPATATPSPGPARGGGPRRRARVLHQRPRCADADLRRSLCWPGRRARSRPRAGTWGTTSSSGPRRCPRVSSVDRRHSSGGTRTPRPTSAEVLASFGVDLRHLVLRAVDGRQRHDRGRPRRPARARGRLRARRRHCGCAPPTTATTRTGS